MHTLLNGKVDGIANITSVGVLAQKIGAIFKMDELILGGGPSLNWSMIRDGLCDELRLLLMPTADAQNHTNSLSESHETFSSLAPVELYFKAAQPLDDDSVWLRYDVVEDD